ncbi:hypothetical protein OPT61_g322 [Boeremia exigua]|uniref:Uncharacterized protein n=1 Tax=Boeremia exigua TaxID=749465 RepID=A0ACC2IUD6_9PLEO|nr:hypothetical protein OPT61_g322 [Boeremia exigua]
MATNDVSKRSGRADTASSSATQQYVDQSLYSDVYLTPASNHTESALRSSSRTTFITMTPRKVALPQIALGGVSQVPMAVEQKLSTAQRQVDRDWKRLMMVVSTIVLACIGRWLLSATIQAIATSVASIAHLLLFLLEQDLDITFGTGLLLWIVFGGHRYLKAPWFLRHPVESEHRQLIKSSQAIAETAASIRLDYSPIDTLYVSSPHSSATNAVITVPPITAANSTTPLPEHVVDQVSILDSTSFDHSGNEYTESDHDLLEISTTKATVDLTIASSQSNGQGRGSIPDEMPLTHVSVKDIARTDTHAAAGVLEHLITPIPDQAVDMSVEETSDSHSSNSTNSSGSYASSHTMPSSEDGAVERHATDTNSHGGSRGEVAASERCPRTRSMIDLDELFKVLMDYGSLKFCEGPLHEVAMSAWIQSNEETETIANAGVTSSNFSGIMSLPGRPLCNDKHDLETLLTMLRPWLPMDIQQHLKHGDITEMARLREDITGLNVHSRRLELLWHQCRTPVVNGAAITVTDISVIYMYEMFRTRNFRPACPPGIAAIPSLTSSFRHYLTDEEEIKINQGCVEHIACEEHAYKCRSLQLLEQHPGHAGAQRGNPVPDWLEDVIEDELYDAHAYLPCTCGEKALNDHITSRYNVEPGYDPSQYAYDVPRLFYLGDDALDQDRQRKEGEDAYFGHTVGFPRSQKFAQDCELHAVPTNKPWILMDGLDDPNCALVGSNNDLPVPGFTELTKYPPGFRMARGFRELEHSALPPRCKHGYLHPPFADHCMGCFPSGENHENCSECEAHDAVRAIIDDPSKEREYEEIRKDWDRAQFEHARKFEEYEKIHVANAKHTANNTLYFSGWPSARCV